MFTGIYYKLWPEARVARHDAKHQALWLLVSFLIWLACLSIGAKGSIQDIYLLFLLICPMIALLSFCRQSLAMPRRDRPLAARYCIQTRRVSENIDHHSQTPKKFPSPSLCKLKAQMAACSRQRATPVSTTILTHHYTIYIVRSILRL